MVASTMQSDRAVKWQCVGFLVLANGCYQSAGTCNDVLANGCYQLAVARSRTWANNNLLANGCYQLAVTCRNVLEYGCHHGWLLATLLWQIVNLQLLFCRMLAIRDYPVEPSPLLGLECTLHFQLTLGIVIAMVDITLQFICCLLLEKGCYLIAVCRLLILARRNVQTVASTCCLLAIHSVYATLL